MMRALWTAATGMIGQQTNVDTISNNLANVNTTGYKKESAEFKSLLYQNIQSKSTNNQGEYKPIPAQVGLGTRVASITSAFDQGALFSSTSNFDFAIEGQGFFKIQLPSGEIAYARNGHFQLSIVDNGVMLNTAEGYPVLDTNNQPIVFPKDINTNSVVVYDDGSIYYKDSKGVDVKSGIKFGLVQFPNAAGLEKGSSTLYYETVASGTPIDEATSTTVKRSNVKQKYLEGSNVQVVDEMVNLIVAQRAYEMNSKAIQAADTMLQQANQLRQ